MKKIIAIILAALTAAAICACGGAQSGQADGGGIIETIDPATADMDAIQSNFDKASEIITSSVDVSSMTEDKDDSQTGAIYCNWYPGEGMEQKELSHEVEIDGHKVVFGETTGKEVKEFGYDQSSPSDAVGPNEIMVIELSKDSKNISVQFESKDNTEKPLDECVAMGFNTIGPEFSLPFNYQGITNESTLEEVISILGAPNSGINLSADSTSTNIEYSYLFESKEQDTPVSDALNVNFRYDAESNTANLGSISFTRTVYTEE